MGGRLSTPQGLDGSNEISRPISGRRPVTLNSKAVVAPLAAFTMAGLLFFYSRTSIQAARLNAQKHREADGGQLNWRNESLRRHGQLERIDERSLIKEAFLGKRGVSVEPQAPTAATRRKSKDEVDLGRALEKWREGQER